jgi:hypothetical protein
MGARVSFAGGKPKVTDGLAIEAAESLGGYWMIEVKSKQEAVDWATRCPASGNEVIEIRRVQEFADFPPMSRRPPPDSPSCRASPDSASPDKTLSLRERAG